MVEPPEKSALIDRRKAVREAVKKLISADFVRDTGASAPGVRVGADDDLAAQPAGKARGGKTGRERVRN